MDDNHASLDGRLVAVLPETSRGLLSGYADEIARAMLASELSLTVGLRIRDEPALPFYAALAAWLAGNPDKRALALYADDRELSVGFDAAAPFCAALGLSCAIAARQADAEADGASLILGSIGVLEARHDEGSLNLGSFALVALPELDEFQNRGLAAALRGLGPKLRSRWERRTVAMSRRFGVKERNLVLDIADAPRELLIEEKDERAKALPQSTWFVAHEDKARLAIGLASADPARPIAIYCNLRSNAEEAAGRLKANGLRVEYIVGNLPRKAEILKAVRTGEYDALILTDEGAEGLETGWAARLINWDLPLEGELYGSRLLCLDYGAPGAQSYNLACDRYVYGIPAVEAYLGYSLDAAQPPEEAFAAEDKSAGMSFERRDRPDRGARHERGERSTRGDARPDDGRPRNARRGDAGRDGQRREGQRREGGRRDDGAAARSIRDDIAALTGGRPAPAGQARDERRPQGGGERNERRADGGRGAKGRNRPERPAGDGRRRDGQAGRKSEGGSAVAGNPYELPMEERMRLYRERYGKRLSASEPAAEGRRGSGRRGRGSAQRGGPPRGDAVPRNAPSVSGSEAARDQGDGARGEAADEGSPGFLGAIRGMFKKKDE